MDLKLPTADPSPYPPIQVREQSRDTVQAMLQNIGSCHSEMTTIGSYVYCGTVLEECCPKAAEYFRAIAKVEMRHLSVFSKLALLSGGDPRLWSLQNGRTAYWDPSCVPYTRDLPLLLRQAAQEESRTIEEYRRQAASLSDPCVQAVLNRVILDEELHVVIFRRLYQEYGYPGNRNRPRKTPSPG